MGVVQTDQFAAIKQFFYDAFDNAEIKEFTVDLGYMVNGTPTNIYRISDGIHLGYRCTMDGATEKEIYDILGSAVKDFIALKSGDSSLASYAKDNIKSLAKILFIDKENFTVII